MDFCIEVLYHIAQLYFVYLFYLVSACGILDFIGSQIFLLFCGALEDFCFLLLFVFL